MYLFVYLYIDVLCLLVIRVLYKQWGLRTVCVHASDNRKICSIATMLYKQKASIYPTLSPAICPKRPSSVCKIYGDHKNGRRNLKHRYWHMILVKGKLHFTIPYHVPSRKLLSNHWLPRDWYKEVKCIIVPELFTKDVGFGCVFIFIFFTARGCFLNWDVTIILYSFDLFNWKYSIKSRTFPSRKHTPTISMSTYIH